MRAVRLAAASLSPVHAATLSLASLALLATPVRAQGWIDPERTPGAVATNGAVHRVGSTVRATLDGRVARVEVEERFRNDGGAIAEGTYFYPMPGEAVFQGFSLWMGDQELRGEMLPAEQARSIYESIVRRRKDPALLTLAGHGLIRAQVFPIQPGETRRVVLRYTQLLDRAGDALRFRYAIGQRGGAPADLAITADSATRYAEPFSPTHAITSRREGNRLAVSLPSGATGDFELFLPLRSGAPTTTLVTHAPAGEDGYFLLMVTPPAAGSATAMPRDLTAVVDVSGSMAGEKLEQARAALRQLLSTLDARDRFRLIAFSNSVRPFRDSWTDASAASLVEARAWIDALQPEGGTNIEGALRAALAEPTNDNERLPMLVFLTDGIPSVGMAEPDRLAGVAAGQAGRTRIFSFGIGTDVNTYLLDRLAADGHGAAEYVLPGASVETAVGALATKLRFPALADLRLAESPVTLTDFEPGQLPDLFAGQELVVLGRYHGSGQGRVAIEGRRGARRERIGADASFPATSSANEFVAKLWAARRIGTLTRIIRLEGSTPERVEQVRQLALRHGLVSEYTSYFVAEPGMVAAEPRPIDDVRRQATMGVGNANRPAAAPMMAAPAANQVGAGAVAASRQSARLEQAKSLDAATGPGAEEERASGRGGVVRAGGRAFVLRDSVWTDLGHRSTLPITDVAPFSAAYFDLLRALPELASPLGVGDRALIAGRRASVRVTPAGATTWKPGQLAALVAAFRGA